MKLCLILTSVALLAGCGADKPTQSELERLLTQQEPRFSAVIDKVEKFHSNTGHYPSDLSSLGDAVKSSVELPPHFKTLRTSPVRYELSRDGSFFRVAYQVNDVEDYELHASSVYLSFDKTWRIDRHATILAHVEALYFGKRYKQIASPENLRLTVSSLLEAARSNSAHPCRNLWASWFDEALGNGDPLLPIYPLISGAGETKIYTTTEKKVTFAVVIESKIFGQMLTPLQVVVGIFELSNEGSKWKLIQQCDSST